MMSNKHNCVPSGVSFTGKTLFGSSSPHSKTTTYFALPLQPSSSVLPINSYEHTRPSGVFASPQRMYPL